MKLIENERIEEDSMGENSLESYTSGVSVDDQELIIDTITGGLYSNPIGSIVRELTSNGIDATIQKDRILPVIVKLGYDGDNDLSYFEVIDNGVGMDKQVLTQIYINIFKSNKRTNDDLIGGFGIGSKSPLSLYNELYITTIKDGIKINAVYFKTNRLPDLTILLEEEIEDVNISGTSIKIYIEDNQVDQYNTEIYRQLRYFSNVIYINEFIPQNAEDFNKSIIYENELFLYSDCSVTDNSEFKSLHIALGNVFYPINFSILDSKFMSYENLPLAVRFDIGEIEVTKSRETIKYTNRTIANLTARLEELIEYLITTQNDRLKTDDLVKYSLQDKGHFIIYNPNSNNIKDLFNNKLESVVIDLPRAIYQNCNFVYTKDTNFKLNSYIDAATNPDHRYRKFIMAIYKGYTKNDAYTSRLQGITDSTTTYSVIPESVLTNEEISVQNTSETLKSIANRTYRRFQFPSYTQKFTQGNLPPERKNFEFLEFRNVRYSPKYISEDFLNIYKEFLEKIKNTHSHLEDVSKYFSPQDLNILRSSPAIKELIPAIHHKPRLNTKYYITESELKSSCYDYSWYPYCKYHGITYSDIIKNGILVQENLSYIDYNSIKENNSFASIREAIEFHKTYVKDIKNNYINFLDIPESFIEEFEDKIINFVEIDNRLKKELINKKRKETIAAKKLLPKEDKKVALKRNLGDEYDLYSVKSLINDYDEIYFPLYPGKEDEYDKLFRKAEEEYNNSEIELFRLQLEIKREVTSIHQNPDVLNSVEYQASLNNSIQKEFKLRQELPFKKQDYECIENLRNLQKEYNTIINAINNQISSAFSSVRLFSISDVYRFLNRTIFDKDGISPNNDTLKILQKGLFKTKFNDLFHYDSTGMKKRILIVSNYRKQDSKIIEALPNYKHHTDLFQTNSLIRNYLSIYYTTIMKLSTNNKLEITKERFNNLNEILFDLNSSLNDYTKDIRTIRSKYKSLKDWERKLTDPLNNNRFTNNYYNLVDIEKRLDHSYRSCDNSSEISRFLIKEFLKSTNIFNRLNIPINEKINNYFIKYREFCFDYKYLFYFTPSKFNNDTFNINYTYPFLNQKKKLYIEKLKELHFVDIKLQSLASKYSSTHKKIKNNKKYQEMLAEHYIKSLFISSNDQLLLPSANNH